MLSKGQGATFATYDCLLLAFDMDGRADEAATLWNMILHAHDRSISKTLFSRMISLYDHHNMPNMIIEVIVIPDFDIMSSYSIGCYFLSEAYICMQFVMFFFVFSW